jgi:hypothetical protein
MYVGTASLETIHGLGTPPSVAAKQQGKDPRLDFAYAFRGLRLRLMGKQIWLASVVGCTVACVSLWEAGKRLPPRASFSTILDAFAKEGATAAELAELDAKWAEARTVVAIAVGARGRSGGASTSTGTTGGSAGGFAGR